MKKRGIKLLGIFLVCSMIVSFAACGGDKGGGDNNSGDKAANGDKVYEWKLQNSYGPGDQTWDIQMPMIVDAIEKATDGRLKITTFQPGAICEPEQAPQSVKEGLLDAAMSTAGDAGAIVPAAYAEQGIPFFWETSQDMFDTYYDFGLLEFLRGEYEKQNIYYGMPVPNGTYNLMTKFPVTQVSDLRGKKIRAVSSWGYFTENLGGSPVVMPGGDIYQGLKLGTIDGTIYTFAELKNAKLGEVVTNVMEQPGSGSGFVSFLINKAKWDELPADLQDAVNNALKEVYTPIMRENIKYDEEARQAAIEEGVKIDKISDENIKAFWDAGLKTADRVAAEHPEAKPGIEIVKKWHDEKK
ncbi:MAG: TRAP transporter substrate-binding protein DctP [Clostridiales Family XIII bacterium]|jgi:TRAP-type C4-dicarboxylate transport system substrate-binding protein|nr:TRAP transporter substrate-binding protein DctP [Clostridiales Family XIII bacterium]